MSLHRLHDMPRPDATLVFTWYAGSPCKYAGDTCHDVLLLDYVCTSQTKHCTMCAQHCPPGNCIHEAMLAHWVCTSIQTATMLAIIIPWCIMSTSCCSMLTRASPGPGVATFHCCITQKTALCSHQELNPCWSGTTGARAGAGAQGGTN